MLQQLVNINRNKNTPRRSAVVVIPFPREITPRRVLNFPTPVATFCGYRQYTQNPRLKSSKQPFASKKRYIACAPRRKQVAVQALELLLISTRYSTATTYSTGITATAVCGTEYQNHKSLSNTPQHTAQETEYTEAERERPVRKRTFAIHAFCLRLSRRNTLAERTPDIPGGGDSCVCRYDYV